ncbi:MAG TPA: methyltransferase domain-containing protein [Acidimicrobiales bacterium]|nr:methyltransferase domain-containing protein [Acidimicrobiales bacterium]
MIAAAPPASPWPVIDSVYHELLASAPPDRRWLLVQTLATASSRRPLQQSLPIGPGSRIVDLGCGYGATSLELAALRPASVVGVDTDEQVLGVASSAAALAEARSGLAPGSSVRFLPADAYDLPFADNSVDAVFCRFVFQHLDSPPAAAAEIERVLRPGGLACVVDVDDALSISDPPPSPAYQRLAAALRASQSGYGGDRHIGRRLAGILDFHGLNPTAVLVLPQAAYHRPAPGDPALRLLVERLEAARARIVAGGHMSAFEFDADLAELAAEEPGPTCEVEAHLAVVATKAG